jgi:hypothetical protein
VPAGPRRRSAGAPARSSPARSTRGRSRPGVVATVAGPGLRGLGWRYARGTGRHHHGDRPALAVIPSSSYRDLASSSGPAALPCRARTAPLDRVALARTLVASLGGGMPGDRCGFCGGVDQPLARVEGLFAVLVCSPCLARRARGRGPYPDLTDAEMRNGLDLLPTWVLEQKTAANRRVVAVMCQRLERGEAVVPMYGPLGLAWLQRQAEVAEQLLRARGQPPGP